MDNGPDGRFTGETQLNRNKLVSLHLFRKLSPHVALFAITRLPNIGAPCPRCRIVLDKRAAPC